MDPIDTEIIRAALATTDPMPWSDDELAHLAQAAMGTDVATRSPIPLAAMPGVMPPSMVRPLTISRTATRTAPRTAFPIRRRVITPFRAAITTVAVCAGAVAIAAFMLRPSAVPAAQREYVTRRAEQATVHLPDGSQVILAPESRLRFAQSPHGAREVELSGQAYFTVTHDPHRSFLVRTGTTTTRVLGTAFTVRAYPTDRVTQVAVAEGKVSVGDEIASAVLLAGDVGHVRPGRAPEVVHDARIADVFGWTRGQLLFDDVPARDIAVDVGRVYDLDIRFADSTVASRPVTLALNGKSDTAILDALTLAIDARYERHGRRVTIRAR